MPRNNVVRADAEEWMYKRFPTGYTFTHHHCSLKWQENFITVDCALHGKKIVKFKYVKYREYPCYFCEALNEKLNLFKEKFPNTDFKLLEFRKHVGENILKYTCYKHGERTSTVRRLMENDYACHTCQQLYGDKDVIGELSEKFPDLNFKYGYDGADKHIFADCKTHGKISRLLNNYRQQDIGCPECAKLKYLEIRCYTRSKFKYFCDKNGGGLGTLYVLKCFNDNECFIKVGITCFNVDKRYKTKYSMPYNYEILSEIKMLPDLCYNSEIDLIRKLKSCRYSPNLYFGGSKTECFYFNEDVLKMIEDYLDGKKYKH